MPGKALAGKARLGFYLCSRRRRCDATAATAARRARRPHVRASSTRRSTRPGVSGRCGGATAAAAVRRLQRDAQQYRGSDARPRCRRRRLAFIRCGRVRRRARRVWWRGRKDLSGDASHPQRVHCAGCARGRVRAARRALASLALGNNTRTHEALAPTALELSASASAAGAADAAAAAAEKLRRRRHAVGVAGAAGRDERDRRGDVAEARHGDGCGRRREHHRRREREECRRVGVFERQRAVRRALLREAEQERATLARQPQAAAATAPPLPRRRPPAPPPPPLSSVVAAATAAVGHRLPIAESTRARARARGHLSTAEYKWLGVRVAVDDPEGCRVGVIAPRPKTCHGVALPAHERERSTEKYSEVGAARRRRRRVGDPPRHPPPDLHDRPKRRTMAS